MPRFTTSLFFAFLIFARACSQSEPIQDRATRESGPESLGQKGLEPLPNIEDAWRAGEFSEGPAEPPMPTQLTGRVSIHHVDDFQMRGENIYYLETDGDGSDDPADKKTLRLKFRKPLQEKLLEGSMVRVSGRLYQSEMEVDAAVSGMASGLQMLSEPVASLVGPQKAIVILANFANKPLACSGSQVQNLMFGASASVDAIYKETSFNQLAFAGDMVGPINLTQTSSNCNYTAWGDEAARIATAQGINLANYNRHVFVFPQPDSCGFAGVGTVGGNPSKTWIVSCDWLTAYVHEIGHNLTMLHSGAATGEYADGSCFMGNPFNTPKLNAPHRIQMGWADSTQVRTLSGTGGSFTLESLGSSTGLQVIKVPNGGNDTYISFRTPTGTDANLRTEYRNRLSIHTWSGGPNATFLKSLVAPGSSYTDTALGLTVRHISQDGARASIQVDFGCSAQTPTLALTPSSQVIGPNTNAVAQLTLQNNDGPGCPSRSFNITHTVSAGWSSTLGSSVDLAAGARTQLTLTLIPPPSSVDGTAGTAVVQVNSNGINFPALSATARVDAMPPSAPANLIATAGSRSISLQWTASQDNQAIARYEVLRNGTVIGSVTASSFLDANVSSKTSYTYQVRAVDASGQLSALSNAVRATASRRK